MSTKKFDKLDSFSKYFNVSQKDVERLGFFDITLNFDSPLCIDSKLLSDSNAPHFLGASTLLKKRFNDLLILLKHAETNDNSDMCWEEANNKMTFIELHGTCLGYSLESTDGKGIGPKLREIMLTRIWKLLKKGRDDPELFELVSVFTEGFGCDRISDLITYMIKEVIFEYNISIIKELKLESFKLIHYMGYWLLENPFKKGRPILLLPSNILSDLPVCFDYSDIQFATELNQEARTNLQRYINFDNEYTKDDIFEVMMKDKVVYDCLINSFRQARGKQYDFERDPKCCFKFRDILFDILEKYPEAFSSTVLAKDDSLYTVVKKCLSLFKHLVEDCGLRNSVREFDEKGSQHLFFATSYYYCDLHEVALCPEANSGRGPVDFLLTNGKDKISVEMKKTSHNKYVEGLTKQLPAYMQSNDSFYGFYVVLNVDSEETDKIQKIYNAHSSMEKEVRDKIEIEIIKAYQIPSASKM